MKCDHDTIVADILEGDFNTIAVNWCQRCGSYRRGFINGFGVMCFSDWTEPDDIETEEPENGWNEGEA